MHTYQIAQTVLDNYSKEKLTAQRVDFLKAQVNEQLEELARNQEIYNTFLEKINPPQAVDNIILWILLMSNEDIVDAYIDAYGKSFREIIPVSDLADLLVYSVHLDKVQGSSLDGFEYLLEYEDPGIDEVDQYAFTNVLLYVEKSKQPEIEF